MILCCYALLERLKELGNVCFDANGHLEFGLKCAVQTKPGLGVVTHAQIFQLEQKKRKLNG